MRSALLRKGGSVELTHVINGIDSKPLLEVEACGICATDRKVFAGPPSTMQLPRVLGHECAGTLVADLGHLKKGSRVVLWPAVACGACVFCRSNRANLCDNLHLFGLHLDGGFSDTLHVPCHLWQKVIVLPLPPALPCSKAVFAEPLGCVLHGLGRVQGVPERIMIHGAGLMGILAARAASCLWPEKEIMLYDINPLRLGSPPAPAFAVDKPGAANLIFIACSSVDAVHSALDLLEPGGTILLFSGLPDRVNELAIDHNHLHRMEQTITGSYGCTPQDMAAAIDLLAEDRLPVDDLLTSTLPLAELGEELARKTTHNDYKTIIAPDPKG